MEDIVELKKCLHIASSSKNINPEEECTKNVLSEIEKKNIYQTLQLRASNGLTPLIYAADRGNCNVSPINFLLLRLFGLVWFGLVWFGLVWFGLVDRKSVV